MTTGQTFTIAQYLDLLRSTAVDSLHVVDLQQNKFRYIKPDDSFLCGYSVEDALKEGFDFYPKIVHPEDLLLWTDICEAVMQYLNTFKDKRGEIDYFSCTFRLQHKYPFLSHPLPQMIHHKMIPIWDKNELRYLICSARISIAGKAGNLQVYNKDKSRYEEFDFVTKRWEQKKKRQLTDREKVILKLAKQGKNSVEIADILSKGKGTIRNQIKTLFSKLNVNSMQEALEFVHLHQMIC